MKSRFFITLISIQLTPITPFSSQRVFISTPARENIKIVSDLMTQNPITLSPSTPVDEAIACLLSAGVSGAPVVERIKSQDETVELSLVGFVSSFDFLPREESGLVTLGEMMDSETARRVLGQSVKDIMTRNPVTVTTNDLMKTAAEVMAKHRLHALPVVDVHHGHLQGVVTAKDVMRDVMKTANKALPSEECFSKQALPDLGGGYIYTPSSSTTTNSQPRINPIAHFVSPPNDGLGNETFATSGDSAAIPTAGRLLAVNSHYIAYAVKKGLVRVIDRQSSAKALLRGHGCRIVDAVFFGDASKVGIGGLWSELANAKLGEFSTSSNNSPSVGAASAASDILATLGGLQDSLFIWRIYNDGELKADKLIELNFNNNTKIGCPGRIMWHSFDPNRFLLLHRKGCTSSGSLVETKRLVTKRDEAGHMVCDCEGDIPGATKFIVDGGAEGAMCDINDACWSSKDARHVLTAHDHGVRLWDVIAVVKVQDEKSFQCVATLNMEPVTRVICLSQYETDGNAGITPPFVTGTDMNHTITLWSGFTSSGTSQKLRVFTLKSSPSSISTLLSLELCPAPYRPSDTTPSSFLLLNERDNAQTHALHLATEWRPSGAVGIMGFDYVTTIDVVHPILSQCIAPNSDNTANLDEERDVDICCVQTKAVQLLTLSGEMVAPPKSMEVPNSVTLIEEEEKEDVLFEEDYDMDEEAKEAEFSTENDADSEVPKEEPASVDPFSNWLGALATNGKSVGSPPPSTSGMPTPPPPPGLDFMFPPPPGMAESSSLLSPMEILGSKNEPFPDPVSSTSSISKSNATRKKEGRKSPPMAILQRQEKETRSASHPSGNNADMRMIEGSMERILANHMKSMESKLLDAVKKTVSSEVEKAVGGKKVMSTLEKAANESATVAAKEAASSMQTPMVTALHQTMREILIPAYEAATTQMFRQITKSVDQGLAKIAVSQSSQPSIESMSKQMTKMAEAIQTLSSEIAQLKSEGVKTGSNSGTHHVAKPAQSKQVDIRQEILALCQSRRYEEAFAKSVSAANGDIVVFTCKNADITAVGFDGEVTLSQTILICLMQQLGAVLVSATDPADFKIIVMWLQEIAVTIDPTNESIQRHVGGVVQQLLSNINSKMSKCDPAFKRPLQTLMQVIKGLL